MIIFLVLCLFVAVESYRYPLYTLKNFNFDLTKHTKHTPTATNVKSSKTLLRSMLGHNGLDFPWPIDVCILINVIVWLSWQNKLKKINKDFMRKNWMLSLRNWRQGRYWTLLTGAFSHISIIHLLANMSFLTSFGPSLVYQLGEKGFCSFVIMSAVISSSVSLISQRFYNFAQYDFRGNIFPKTSANRYGYFSQGIQRAHPEVYSLGFSGINCAMFVLQAYSRPSYGSRSMQVSSPFGKVLLLSCQLIIDY